MAKNLVLCCDGTANQFGTTNTNVVHLFSMLIHDPAMQMTYYHPGLGTMGAPGAWTRMSQSISRLLGQAIGRGLKDDVRDAYVFLMQNYEPGDRVFLFGFSRGAYTARVVAGILHMFGLIRRGNEPLVPYAVEMLAKHPDDETFRIAADFKTTFSRECDIHFVGVWDTVNSVGWFWDPVKIPYAASNPSIAVGRHAIAIDERRAFFRTNLWRWREPNRPHGPRDVKQVWFPGVHCDVGGGYPEAQSGLSKVALKWMVREAEGNGLLVDPAKRDEILGGRGTTQYTAPDSRATMHESLTGFWQIAEFIPKPHYNWQTGTTERRMNLFRPRTIPENSDIHRAAFERGVGYPKHLPETYRQVE
jgi:uncharacterized protein (DUF2235 family)